MVRVPRIFSPRKLIIAIVLVGSVWFWYLGYRNSPNITGLLPSKPIQPGLSKMSNDPEAEKEMALARAYWQRYPDVRQHSYFGISGIMGIRGAREHYRQYGKREGRVWGIQPEDHEKDTP